MGHVCCLKTFILKIGKMYQRCICCTGLSGFMKNLLICSLLLMILMEVGVCSKAGEETQLKENFRDNDQGS